MIPRSTWGINSSPRRCNMSGEKRRCSARIGITPPRQIAQGRDRQMPAPNPLVQPCFRPAIAQNLEHLLALGERLIARIEHEQVVLDRDRLIASDDCSDRALSIARCGRASDRYKRGCETASLKA